MRKEEDESAVPNLSTSNIIQRTIIGIVEGITGISVSDRQQWFLSLGHLLQRLRSGRFLETLKDEWDEYREKGRVKDDYLLTDQHQECLQELLDFLDQDSPDEIRFTVLKKIFLTASTETISDRTSALPQQYMMISRGLSSGETLVLLGTYKLARDDAQLDRPGHAAHWLKEVAQASGLVYPELVELHERDLIGKNLLTQRSYPDRSGVTLGSHLRLTDLGWEICTFIEEYDRQKDA